MKIVKMIVISAMALATASVVNAEVVLTLNGIDAVKEPVEIVGKEDLIVAVEGEVVEDVVYLVTVEKGGEIKPVTSLESSVQKLPESFLFRFDEENPSVGVVNLYAGDDHMYKLVLFYNSATDTTIALGIGYEHLHWVPPVEEPKVVEQESVVPDALQSWRFKPREESHDKVLLTCPSVQVSKATITSKEVRGSERTFATTTGGGGILLDGGIVDITSDITINTVWTSDNTYHVLNPIDVNGAMLVIEPGTIVAFATGVSAGIRTLSGGVVISRGTAQNPIVFTSDSATPAYNDYDCPLYITETGSTATEMTYTIVEWAYAGVVVLNRNLDKNIENNYFVNCVYGIIEYGPEHTHIVNNLCFGSYYSGIEIYLASITGVANANSVIYIENNTCDYYQDNGITVHGVTASEDSGSVFIGNNIVSGSYVAGLNLVDGYMYASVLNTGYYDNFANKNWEFDELNPIIVTTNPYETGASGYAPICYLNQSCDFIDAGSLLPEQTQFVGKTTYTTLAPDGNVTDIGFHYPNWSYVNAGTGMALGDINRNTITDLEDLILLTSHWLEPASPSSEVNLNGDSTVNLLDFAILGASWQKIQGFPDITAVVSGDPSGGWINVGVNGYAPDTHYVSVFVEGKYAGKLFGFRNGNTLGVDISEFGNQTLDIKLVGTGSTGNIVCSDAVETAFPNSLNYCILPQSYKPNEPLPFAAYNTVAGDASVNVYADGGNLVWSQSYSGNTVSGSIPASITGQHEIDYVSFEPNGGTSVSKTSDPAEDELSTPDSDVKALVILPDLQIRLYDFRTISQVQNAFKDRGVKYKKLAGKSATYQNVAKYASTGNIKYLFIDGHGTYVGNENPLIFRTCVELKDDWVLSAKHSDFLPGQAPSWCEELPGNLEQTTKSFASMGFNSLEFAYFDTCHSGRLKINSIGLLVEGQPGQMGLFDGPHSDMSLALGMDDTSESRVYQGWYGEISSNFPPVWPFETEYQKWSQYQWESLGEGNNLLQAIMDTINQQTEFGDEDPVNNYRLKGQGLLTDMRLSSN